ncbi:hypothetical protein Q0Z83_090030 [Actinoplanes sichuanensis]|nr:hypothetical protein Q0Z83_090030 [Actinoplanes sichuanensis]
MASSGGRDSHGDVIVGAGPLGYRADRRATGFDVNYFAMLRQMLYGGGALWFEDIYTLTGFLLTGPGRHRLYITDGGTGARPRPGPSVDPDRRDRPARTGRVVSGGAPGPGS